MRPFLKHSLLQLALLPALFIVTACITACGKKESAAGATVAQLDGSLTRAQIESGPLEPTCSLEGVFAIATQTRYVAEGAAYSVPKDLAYKLIGFGTRKAAGSTLGPFSLHLASVAAVYTVQGQTGLERPDVVAYFNSPGMLGASFQVDVDLKGVPSGDYAVYLKPSTGPTCPTHHTNRVS
jgi:hypothetical protein